MKDNFLTPINNGFFGNLATWLCMRNAKKRKLTNQNNNKEKKLSKIIFFNEKAMKRWK